MLNQSPEKLRVAVVGLGPIGLETAKKIAVDGEMQLSALVDLDPAKFHKSLAQLTGGPVEGPSVLADLDDVGAIDLAILCTGSHFDRIAPTLRQCLRKKAHVVSSCEEMAWPWLRHPHLADVLNAEAIAAGVAMVGTGVNPGFVMDLLPVILSSMTTGVKRVRVTRVVDASTRRIPLQRKIGATMTPEHFRKLATQNQIGHMGMGESVVMLAQGLGRHPMQKEVRTSLAPVLAEHDVACGLGPIEAGRVRGMYNTGHWSGGGLEIELELTMAVGEKQPRDEIEITADRDLHVVIPGSTPGDTATVAALVNVARVLPRVKPGLRTMLDLPAVGSR